MDHPDGRKHDLFDASCRSGRLDLFGNRKRKAGAMASPERGLHDRYEPAAGYERHHYPPRLETGAVLRREYFSRHDYQEMQDVLRDRDQELEHVREDLRSMTLDLSQETKRRSAEVGSLKKQIERLKKESDGLKEEKRRLTTGEGSAKQLRQKRAALQDQVKEKDELLALGTKVLNEKTEMAERLEEENVRLRETVTERDATVSKLNEQVWRLTTAPADQVVHARLEVQAERTLGMMNGLKKDIQTRDAKIKDLEGQVGKMHAVMEGQNKGKLNSQRGVEDSKREFAKQKEAAEAAAKRAKDAREVAVEQEVLIKKILEENRRLAGLAYVNHQAA